jgi:AcrR family transcriptional regulator
MPRYVDHDQRKREILDATSKVLGQGGLSALSFRAVAKELGGSTTLVTHYFATQSDLLDGLAGWLVDDWEADLADLETGVDDPHKRLVLFLEWLIPDSPESLLQERARIGLLAEKQVRSETTEMFNVWDRRMRKLIREHLKPIVPKKELEMRVDMIRVMTNGLTFSAIEHPDDWSPKHMRAVLDQSLIDMGLTAK